MVPRTNKHKLSCIIIIYVEITQDVSDGNAVQRV